MHMRLSGYIARAFLSTCPMLEFVLENCVYLNNYFLPAVFWCVMMS